MAIRTVHLSRLWLRSLQKNPGYVPTAFLISRNFWNSGLLV